jgi:predicted alpha/beta hydrolase family esterase
MRNAFIFHGTDGTPQENWFPWLKAQLELLGYEVFVPQFPTPENQTPEHWMKTFEPYRGRLNQETVVFGHSLGGTFLFRLLETVSSPIKAAFLVATPIGVPPVKYQATDQPFSGHPFDWEKIHNHAEQFFVFHSDNDPFVSLENGIQLAHHLNAPLFQISGAGHFNAASGYTQFDALLNTLQTLR